MECPECGSVMVLRFACDKCGRLAHLLEAPFGEIPDVTCPVCGESYSAAYVPGVIVSEVEGLKSEVRFLKLAIKLLVNLMAAEEGSKTAEFLARREELGQQICSAFQIPAECFDELHTSELFGGG